MLHQNRRSKKSKSDNWWTPKEKFLELLEEYYFKPDLDAAADEENTLCEYYLDKESDALSENTTWTVNNKKKTKVWINPPNGDEKYVVEVVMKSGEVRKITKTKRLLSLYIARAYLEFCKGRQIMMIVPLNVQSSNSFWDNVQLPLENGEDIFVRPIKRRIPFQENGKPSKASINGYCVILFGFKKGLYRK